LQTEENSVNKSLSDSKQWTRFKIKSITWKLWTVNEENQY
jgi:hypothetical protein